MGRSRGLICGIGVNDANYVTESIENGNRVRCVSYVSWKNMIERCYSKKYHKIRKTYIGTTVCDEWLSFMEFRKWWLDNFVYGWHLDKDLLTDCREYSPDNCIYIPAWLNTFTTDSGSSRGEWPIGVYFNKRSELFAAQCNNPITSKIESLGLFSYPEDAHKAWRLRKIFWADELKVKMDEIDKRIHPRVIHIINNAR